MRFLDEKNNVIENPDLTKGELLPDIYVVVAKYENDKWITYVGTEQVNVAVEIPEDAPTQNHLIFTEDIMRYHVYTAEELEEKKKGTIKERVENLENNMELTVSYDEMYAAIQEGVNEV